MSLLIKNGEIVTADARYVADIFCEGETITRIDKNISAPGAEVIDATGQFVFPGWDESFFGDLHIQGKEGVQFYTQQKVVSTRWFGEGVGDVWKK